MSELPFALADPRVGMLEEALALCRRMATVGEAGDYLGTLGVILCEAGRRDDAFRQVEENLARFPAELGVRFKAGDVYRKAGDPMSAEALYREAYDMTEAAHGGHDRYAAVERLLDLYREVGREEEYVALAADEADLIEHWEPAEEDGVDEGGEEHWPEGAPWEEEGLSPASSEAAFAPAVSPEAQTVQRSGPKVGRNEPCPCGSGKKYKRCCGA
jgi:tetratricopeptide (TPR) repeat protein